MPYFPQPNLTQAGAPLDQKVERGADLYVVIVEIEDLKRLQPTNTGTVRRP